MTDLHRMQIGQIVDFCVEYNNRQKQAKDELKKAEKKKVKKHRANQDEINAFFG